MLTRGFMLVILLGVVATIALSLIGNRATSPMKTGTVRELSLSLEEVRPTDTYAGHEKRYTLTLPDTVSGEDDLFLFFVHQYAEILLDDMPMVTVREPDGWHLGQTPGCYWEIIPLTAEIMPEARSLFSLSRFICLWKIGSQGFLWDNGAGFCKRSVWNRLPS